MSSSTPAPPQSLVNDASARVASAKQPPRNLWTHDLDAFEGRTRAAARLTIVVCLVVLIGLWIELPALAIAAYVVLFSYRRTAQETSKLGVAFAVFGVLAALMAIGIWRLTANFAALRVALLAGGTFVAMYARALGGKGMPLYALGVFTVCMVTFLSLVPDAGLVTQLVLKAALAIAIAGLLAAAAPWVLYCAKDGEVPPVGPGEDSESETPPSASERASFAIRASGAAMAGYLLFNLTDWFGIHTCMFTALFICSMQRESARHKGALRITGASIGSVLALLALVFVVPHLDSVAGLFMLIAPITFLAAWIAVGPDRVAYAGLQIGLAFYLALLGHDGPTTDLAKARDRVIGVFVGVLLVWLAFDVVLPRAERLDDPDPSR